jgi:hypothetical protein
MFRQPTTLVALALLTLSLGWAAGYAQGSKEKAPMIYELRTYTSPEGKLPELHARFRDHTLKLFQKHGMSNVVYLVPNEQPNTLVYLLAHDSVEARNASFDAFRKDPEWLKVKAETEANGPIVTKVDSVLLTPTDYSPMK